MCLINLQQLYSSKIIQWPNNILIHDSGKVIVRKGVMKMEVLDWGVGSPSRCNALSRFTNGPGRSNLPWISQTSSHHWCYDDEGEIYKSVSLTFTRADQVFGDQHHITHEELVKFSPKRS